MVAVAIHATTSTAVATAVLLFVVAFIAHLLPLHD
jgi:hypothetical protein